MQSAILEELSTSQEFISTPAGWKLASNGMPPVAKKRKFEISYDISNATQNSEQQPVSLIKAKDDIFHIVATLLFLITNYLIQAFDTLSLNWLLQFSLKRVFVCCPEFHLKFSRVLLILLSIEVSWNVLIRRHFAQTFPSCLTKSEFPLHPKIWFLLRIPLCTTTIIAFPRYYFKISGVTY